MIATADPSRTARRWPVWKAALGVALIAAFFRLPNLGKPAEEVFDEVYHAKTALQYLEGVPPTEWVHPPTAKLLIAVGVWLFGYEPWAWRLLPALAGVALAPVFLLLAREATASVRAALIACALLLCDGVYLVQSRIAMTNIFAVLFQLCSALLILRSARRERLPLAAMLGAGVALGLALSTRWTSLWAWGFLGLVLVAMRRRRLLAPREIALTALAFVLIPAAVYLLSYVPWMRQQDLPLTAEGLKRGLIDLARLQKSMWQYHANLRATHPYFSAWYTWPWLYRPTWYHFKQAEGWVRGIVAVGNPALWWASVPITIWSLATGLSRRDWRRLFAGAGFVCMYLPWGISPRTLNYSHYLFEAIPYSCLALGMLLDGWWEREKARWIAKGYLALVAVLFVFFLPFLTALPVPQDWYYFRIFDGVRPWTWFRTWI